MLVDDNDYDDSDNDDDIADINDFDECDYDVVVKGADYDRLR